MTRSHRRHVTITEGQRLISKLRDIWVANTEQHARIAKWGVRIYQFSIHKTGALPLIPHCLLGYTFPRVDVQLLNSTSPTTPLPGHLNFDP